MSEDGKATEGRLIKHSQHSALHYHSHWQSQGHGPAHFFPNWFNPLHLEFCDPSNHARVLWNSREHRKGRFVRVATHPNQRVKRPRYRLFGVELRNISWWVAFLFTTGSVCWVLNGQFLFFPGEGPSSNFNLYFTVYEINFADADYTALAGGTLFWFGAYFAVVEALNVGHKVRAAHKVVHDTEAPGEAGEVHLGPSDAYQGHTRPREEPEEKYKWWGWRFHDFGYCAAFVQFIGATLFQASVIIELPGVLASEAGSNVGAWDATFWSFQTVGSWGFIISATMFCLEVQKHWWLPRPFNLGWQIGLWNIIGAFGFEFSAIFGYWALSGKYQRWGSAFSTYWGAWAFLIGSYLQLLETLNKHPTAKSTTDLVKEGKPQHDSALSNGHKDQPQ